MHDIDVKANVAELLGEIKEGRRRRFRDYLCVRNHAVVESTVANLLDGSRTVEAYSNYPARFQTNLHISKA